MALARTLLPYLPYLTLLVGVLGLTRRLVRWRRAPVASAPLFPLPPTRTATWRRMAAELCLLRGLHAGDRSLWLGAWPLHVALALLAVGHIRAFVDFPGLWRVLGLSPEAVDRLAGASGDAVGLVAMAACLSLLARRGLVRRVREITRPGDVLALLGLIAVIVSGNALRFGPPVDLDPVRDYFAALLRLRPGPLPELPGFAVHFLLAQALFAWAPWSKLLHAPGVFFAKATLYR
jgi:nitrate reductase gamma subunit